MLCWSGLSKSGRIRNILQEFQGHRTDQAYYRLGIMSSEYLDLKRSPNGSGHKSTVPSCERTITWYDIMQLMS